MSEERRKHTLECVFECLETKRQQMRISLTLESKNIVRAYHMRMCVCVCVFVCVCVCMCVCVCVKKKKEERTLSQSDSFRLSHCLSALCLSPPLSDHRVQRKPIGAAVADAEPREAAGSPGRPSCSPWPKKG